MKKTSVAGYPLGAAARMAGSALGTTAANAEARAILLVSNDAELGRKLELAAEKLKRPVMRVTEVSKAIRTVHASRPGAVLLDLDLPDPAAWRLADVLLRDQMSLPIVLLTGRTEHFDVRTAIRAGALFEKAVGPDRLGQLVDWAVSAGSSAGHHWKTTQRLLIQWLSPCGWSAPFTPTRRLSLSHD